MLETGPHLNKVAILCDKSPEEILNYSNFTNIGMKFLVGPIHNDYPGNVTGRVIDLVSKGETNTDFALFAYLRWYEKQHKGTIPSHRNPNEPIELQEIITPELNANETLLNLMMCQEEILKIVRKKPNFEPSFVNLTQPNTNTTPNNPTPKNAGLLNKAWGQLTFKAQSLIRSASIILGLIALQYMNLFLAAASVLFALSGLLTARIIRESVIRHSKNHYVHLVSKEKHELSANEALSYELGKKANHSTVTWLYSCVSPMAITHPRAYYAGFEMGRRRNGMS